jgi:vitamin B12 transporter
VTLRRRLLLQLPIAVALSSAASARADEVIVVHGDKPRGGLDDLTGEEEDARDRRAALAEAPFVTRIHVDAHQGETATLADVVAESVGTHVRSLGGLGSYSAISVRGAASGHTTVLVDGVPLSRVAAVTADLGRFELDSFGDVELYRGGVPAALGGAALGGALSLETRLGPTADGASYVVSAGAGSFGARHLRTRWGTGDASEGTAATIELGYAGAEGDFRYFDDRGTNLSPGDDGYETRANNGYDHVDAVARMGGAEWVAGLRGLWRTQGLPGATFDRAMEAQLDSASLLADGGWTRDAIELHGWALGERQHFDDRAGEIGLSADRRRYWTLAAGGSATYTYRRDIHAVIGALDLRGDWFRDDELLAGEPRVYGDRAAVGLMLADDVALFDGRWVIEPAVRVDVMRTDPVADRYLTGEPEAKKRTDVAPSPRVSTRALLGEDVALKASAGWYFRAPTVLELYGDRGFIVGTPDLRPEKGPSVDAGIIVAPARAKGPVDRILVEAAVFASRPEDTIALVTTSALVARALNVGGARVAGVEAAASARLVRTVTASANYTFLSTRQETETPSYDGKPLPQRPRHSLYGRLDVARELYGHLAVVWADATWIGGNYLDQAALNEVPSRRFLGAGLKLELGAGVIAGLEVKNLLDERVERIALDPPPRPDLATVPRAVSDVGGYPLPGRAVYLDVSWRR